MLAKHSSHLINVMLGIFILTVASVAVSRPAAAQACTSATPECTEWVKLGTKSSRSLIYRSHSLDKSNTRIRRAFILVHGAGRNADDYFKSAVAAAFIADALEDTIVIAPRFAANGGGGCSDTLGQDEINWNCSSWRSGGPATSDPQVNSYDLMDEILRRLARKDVFPNLGVIVLGGHSAGGQYVTRYGMVNLVHDKLGVPVSYIVSNPSSYAYPDSNRPLNGTDEMRAFGDARNCTTYDRWPYGFLERSGYSAKLSDDQMKKQLAERPVTYLLGGLDTLPLAGFDSSCPAMAQGPSRLERGRAFSKYVNQKYGAHHQTIVVPLCGHNARCMFTDNLALPIVFPKQ